MAFIERMSVSTPRASEVPFLPANDGSRCVSAQHSIYTSSDALAQRFSHVYTHENGY